MSYDKPILSDTSSTRGAGFGAPLVFVAANVNWALNVSTTVNVAQVVYLNVEYVSNLTTK